MGGNLPETLLDVPQPRDPGDVGTRYDQMLPVAAHPEPRAPTYEIVASSIRRGGIVHTHVEQVHASLVRGFHHDGHAVELVVAVMKHVCAQAAAPAPKCLSNAFTRSPAMDCGLLPSI